MSAPVGSVDFAVGGGLCLCQPNKCMNFNPCVEFYIEKNNGALTPSGSAALGQSFDVYVNHHVDKTKNTAFFMEEPGPGFGEFKLCCMIGLFTWGLCCIPLACLQVVSASTLRKSMGLFFTLENGKVKSVIHDKQFCDGTPEPVTLENVCDLRVVVDRTLDSMTRGPGGHYALGQHYATYFLAFEITFIKPDGSKGTHLTRPCINQVLYGTIKKQFEPFVFGVRELISLSDLRVLDANSVPDIYKPTNYISDHNLQSDAVAVATVQYVHPLSHPPMATPQGQVMERSTAAEGAYNASNGGGGVVEMKMATAVGYEVVSTQDSNHGKY